MQQNHQVLLQVLWVTNSHSAKIVKITLKTLNMFTQIEYENVLLDYLPF